MEMKPSLSTSENQMQDLHAEHHHHHRHHHHQSNLTLARPGYEKHASVLIALIKTVANVVPQPPECGGCRRGSSSLFACLFLSQLFS